jgi:hypothetical protein
MTTKQSEASRLAYEYASSRHAESCCTKVDRFMAGFRAAIEQAEKMDYGDGWIALKDLKSLLEVKE